MGLQERIAEMNTSREDAENRRRSLIEALRVEAAVKRLSGMFEVEVTREVVNHQEVFLVDDFLFIEIREKDTEMPYLEYVPYVVGSQIDRLGSARVMKFRARSVEELAEVVKENPEVDFQGELVLAVLVDTRVSQLLRQKRLQSDGDDWEYSDSGSGRW